MKSPPVDHGFVPSALGFYALLGVMGVGWMWLRGEPQTRTWIRSEQHDAWVQALTGITFGLVVVALGQVAERHLEVARRLSREIRTLLPPLGPMEIAIIAVVSSLGEELFFRGAMQDHIGLWLTAGVFAIMHGFFDRRYLLWVAFAGIMGLAFGLMTLVFGTLLAPVLAHFTINFANLSLLVNSMDPNTAGDTGGGR